MFSGQGSQYHQMGRQLYEENAAFRRWMVCLDDLACGLSGRRVIHAVHAGSRGDVFDRLLLTHPAIFMVEYALARCLIEEGVEPDVTLGASLGTFAAAAIAGFIEPEDALAAVLAQAATFEEIGEPGGMVAIMADPFRHEQDWLREHSEIASINFDRHFVVSAPARELDAIESGLEERGVAFHRLPVRFAFHSRWIDRMREPLASAMASLRIGPGELPLACCERGGEMARMPADHFWRVVRNPIRFRDTIRDLERQGSHRYVDVGPSGTLATFAKHALPAATASTTHAILTPYGQDLRNLDALLATA
jgi:acyl transferase domain-containing protein